MHLEINNQKKIDYKEIARLPFLELDEAIDIFAGVIHFPDLWRPTFEEEKYLLREQIYSNQTNYPFSQSPHSKLRERLRENISSLLELGIEIEALSIKTLRPIWPTFPSPPPEEQMLYFCRTEFLLHWVLKEGRSLPKDLQSEFGIKQANDIHTDLSLTESHHICLQGLAQLLWSLKENEVLNQGNLIELMKEIIGSNLFRGRQLRQSHAGKGPLDALASDVDGEREIKYFPLEKQNILRKLLSQIDPRSKRHKKGRQNKLKIFQDLSERTNGPSPLRPIPGVFSNDKPSRSINFQKLALVLQTFGYYLYKMRFVSHLEDALCHPTIAYYLQDDEALKKYAIFCLKDVCPKKEYVEFIKIIKSDPKNDLARRIQKGLKKHCSNLPFKN